MQSCGMGSCASGSGLGRMEKLSRQDAAPLHVQVADFVREKIYSREWGGSEPIPSEHELMDMLGLSRGTVQKGIRALVDEGLLTQQRGRGTFVTRPVMARPSGNRLLSFGESMSVQGIRFRTIVCEKRVEKAEGLCATSLGLRPQDPYLYLARVRTVEGVPVMFIESHLNLKAAPGLDKVDFEHESLFAAVERCSGRAIGHSEQRFCACVAGRDRAKWLKCDDKAPVLNLEQLVTLDNGVPFEWGTVWLPANRCVISTTTERACGVIGE